MGIAKPAAKIYHAATTYLGLRPEQVLHVGDDAVADAWGAKEAGLQTAWINPEGNLWVHESPQPWTVRDLAEVAQYLQV